MEQWEILIKQFSHGENLKLIQKALKTVEVIIKEDLAEFEIEWLIRTLLYEPVNMLAVVKDNSDDVVQNKTVENIFKLLAVFIDKFPNQTSEYSEEIVAICLLPFVPDVRKSAYNCLATVIRVWAGVETDAIVRCIDYLEDGETCKAPLAVVVGALCEYRPESITNTQRILNIYLSMLQTKKNTATVLHAVLVGVKGLLKSFANDLQTHDLKELYDEIIKRLTCSKCETVCVSILEEHALIFREWISKETRDHAWGALAASSGSSRGCVRALYVALCKNYQDRGSNMQTIINEVNNYAVSSNTYVKYTALWVLWYIRKTDMASQVNVQQLEFELQRGKITYEVAEAIRWCIEVNVPDCDKLLETAILFYWNIPEARRRQVVVDGILNSTPELRSAAVTFLAMETCRDSNLEQNKYVQLWTDLFEPSTEATTLTAVFDDLINYVVFVIKAASEDDDSDDKVLPSSVEPLLKLVEMVACLPSNSQYVGNGWTISGSSLVDCVRRRLPVSVSVARILSAHAWGDTALAEFYKMLNINKCNDEQMLFECCKAIVQSPENVAFDLYSHLTSIQIIFSRYDVEPELLLETLHKLELLISTRRDILNEKLFSKIVFLLDKIRARKCLKGKYARTLVKDILMFLGEHGSHRVEDTTRETECYTCLVKLKPSLIITSTDNVKVNVQSMLQLAVVNEDINILEMLFDILSDIQRNTSSQDAIDDIDKALCVVIHSLCGAHTPISSPRALASASIGLLPHIIDEKYPGVRKMMCDALGDSMLRERVSESGIATVVEHALIMLEGDGDVTKQAGLDLTDSILPAISNNIEYVTKYLPNLLTPILSTDQHDTKRIFEAASKILRDNIFVIEDNDVDDVIDKLLHLVCGLGCSESNMTAHDQLMFKRSVKTCLLFVCDVCKQKRIDYMNIFHRLLRYQDGGHFVKFVHVMAEFGRIFQFESEYNKSKYEKEINSILNLITKRVNWHDKLFLEAILNFLIVYYYASDVESYYKLLSDIIENIKPDFVMSLHVKLNDCVNKTRPQKFESNFKRWCEKFIFQDEIISVMDIDSVKVSSLKKLLNIFDGNNGFLAENLKNIPSEIFDTYNENVRDTMLLYTDLLSMTIKYVDLKQYITKTGVNFCRLFIAVFAELFLEEPFILLDKDMGSFCVIVNDVAKFLVKNKHTERDVRAIFTLSDELWPEFERRTSFNEKKSLLSHLSRLRKLTDSDSNPLRWAKKVIQSEASEDMKTRLIELLPGGEAYSETYLVYTSCLPSRMREVPGSSLRSLLDSLAATKDSQLLRIIASLVAGENSSGWWDEALLTCAAELARTTSGELDFYRALYDQCWGKFLESGVQVCEKLMVPLLRNSTSIVCENFFADKLKDLMSKLNRKRPVSNADFVYHMNLIDYTRAALILQMAFEKIEPSSLESPTSKLYSQTTVPMDSKSGAPQTWYIVKSVCALCASLQKAVSLPVDSDAKLKATYIKFQCAFYNCLCAAICCYKPNYNIYDRFLFNASTWEALIDPMEHLDVHIQSRFLERRTRHSVSLPTSDVFNERTSRTLLTTHTTLRTRIFLRTLSEDPLQYDLLNLHEEPEVSCQEIQLVDNAINRHPCSSTLTALWSHAITLQSEDWCQTLANVLTNSNNTNAKWLLAQTICNDKEELKSYASTLRPALLAVAATTCCHINGKTVLNGLHIDVLETLILWKDDTVIAESSVAHINDIIRCMITTCLEKRNARSIYNHLLDVFVRFLNAYDNCHLSVEWATFEDYLKDRSSLKECYDLLMRVAKKNIYVQGCLPVLIQKLTSERGLDINIKSQMSKLIGFTMSSCTDSDVKMAAIMQFTKWLTKMASVTSDYIKCLYNAQMACNSVCDLRNFKQVVNLVPKVPDKDKCLKIISSYLDSGGERDGNIGDIFRTIGLDELLATNPVEAMEVMKQGFSVMDDDLKRRMMTAVVEASRHPTVAVRSAAYKVMLEASEELLDSLTSIEPAMKRKQNIRGSSKLASALLSGDHSDMLACIGRGLVDTDDGVVTVIRQWVLKHLDDRITVRFYEAFYLAIYLPSADAFKNGQYIRSDCVVAMLKLFFANERIRDSFKRTRREQQTNQDVISSSMLLTKSRTYRGTFRSSVVSGKRILSKVPMPPSEESVTTDVITNLLTFAKTNSSVSYALLVEVLTALLKRPCVEFDFDLEMIQVLGDLLKQGLSEVTPLAVEACRTVLIHGTCKSDERLRTIAQNLLDSTMGSEGEGLVRLLVEDLALRSPVPSDMILGLVRDTNDVSMENIEKSFSINDLVSTFGKLSNWDSLTMKQQRSLRMEIPPLWTSFERFQTEIQNYAGGSDWFQKMCSSLSHKRVNNALQWLCESDRWPRKQFNMSAVSDIMLWQEMSEDGLSRLNIDLKPEDCLAEWAARLMIRKAFLQTLDSESMEPTTELSQLARSHELLWCVRANEMAIPSVVLQCVERNNQLNDSEKNAWFYQYLVAKRMKAESENDFGLLESLLTRINNYFSFQDAVNAPKIGFNMNKLVLMLNNDLKSLTSTQLLHTVDQVDKQRDSVHSPLSSTAKKALSELYDYIIRNYDDLWTEEKDINEFVINMCDMLLRVYDIGGTCSDKLCLILTRLNMGVAMNETASDKLIRMLEILKARLDYFTLEFLKKHKESFLSRSHSCNSALTAILGSEKDRLITYKRCIELLCDAKYSLKSYCETLRNALREKDEALWEVTFARMRRKIFENEFAGTDYKQLLKHRHVLLQLEAFEPTDEFVNKAKQVLDSIVDEYKSEKRDSLRLSHMCPRLADVYTHTDEDKEVLAKLLGLPAGVHVVKFYEQVSVFVDSIRRPVVLRVLTATGATRRYVHKSGEELRHDAVSQRLLDDDYRYEVTPISEDSALIEYLEDHKRLGEMIQASCNSDAILNYAQIHRKESILLTSRESALNIYHELCARLPSYGLRSAVEYHCSSVQEFLDKKHRYTSTLATMTLLCWILGVGDRHLNNIMYSIRDGSVRSVDWGKALQWGGGDSEPAPARLTRNLVALCNTNLLISKLQYQLQAYRHNSKQFLALIKISYTWMEDGFDEKFEYIRNIVEGKSLPHHITAKAVVSSDKRYKDSYVKILDELFKDYPAQDLYSVEDQISCLLRHCTHPSVLSITRTLWEPWV